MLDTAGASWTFGLLLISPASNLIQTFDTVTESQEVYHE